jgi:hypothetical protein
MPGHQHLSYGASRFRVDQDQCGSAQSSAHDSPNRVDFCSTDPRPSVGDLVSPNGGSFRHHVQSSPTNLRLPSARSKGLARRRVHLPLEWHDQLRVPSLADPRQGAQESETRESQDDSHRSKLASPTLVPGSLDLTHVPPLQLLLRGRSLLQPRSGVPYGNVSLLNLHAWLLCGASCDHGVLLQRH